MPDCPVAILAVGGGRCRGVSLEVAMAGDLIFAAPRRSRHPRMGYSVDADFTKAGGQAGGMVLFDIQQPHDIPAAIVGISQPVPGRL